MNMLISSREILIYVLFVAVSIFMILQILWLQEKPSRATVHQDIFPDVKQ